MYLNLKEKIENERGKESEGVREREKERVSEGMRERKTQRERVILENGEKMIVFNSFFLPK